MVKNYLWIIVRNLNRHKIYSIISVISLVIGLSCTLFAYLYINYELSYDDFFEHSENIVRLGHVSSFTEGSSVRDAYLPGKYIPLNLSSFPGIKQTTRLVRLPAVLIGIKRQNGIIEKGAFAADSSFFDFFSFDIIAGDKNKPLAKPNTIILTQETAKRYFGEKKPIGKEVTISFRKYEMTLTVGAVMENIPSNTHLKFNFLMSESAYQRFFGFGFEKSFIGYQYLLLTKNAELEKIGKKLNEIKDARNEESLAYISYRLQPITSIHLHSSANGKMKEGSSILYLYIFGAVAAIILIISCINFISLFLSESAYRYKEMGMRKVFGAQKYQLVFRLLLEATIIVLISFILALLVASLTLPLFNSLTGKSFVIKDIFSIGLLWKGIIFSVLIGLISGSYPGWSIFRKSRNYMTAKYLTGRPQKSFFQNGIIVVQFAATAILIVGTLVIYSQLNFIQQKDLGFNEERIITVPNYLGKQASLFKQLLSNNSNIKNISVSSYVPGVNEVSGTALVKSLSNGKEITVSWISLDYNFFETYDIPVIKGRSFSKKYAADSLNKFMLNEMAVKVLQLEHPIGNQIVVGTEKGTVIGVVKNFNYLSLSKQIPPMIFQMNDNLYFSISVKIAKNANIQHVLSQIETAWFKTEENAPFDYAFLQDRMVQLYESDRSLAAIIFTFSIIAILISCIGLFSLAAYSIQRKTKEIGVRKVLGANERNILKLFYSRFFKLILIANIVGFPLAYFISRYWLTNFAFKINITVFPFLISFAITFLLSVTAVSYWALKAAFLNPVDSIRTE